jgi:alanine racemase
MPITPGAQTTEASATAEEETPAAEATPVRPPAGVRGEPRASAQPSEPLEPSDGLDSPEALDPLDPLAKALRPAWVDIDLDALERNLGRLTAAVRPARVLAVVKADAYGHGAPRVARLLEEAGVAAAGVALVEEGAALRRAGVGLPILVLGPAQAAQLPLFRRYRLTPTVASLDQLVLWNEYAAADPGGRRQTVHLKVDTGMSRLGVAPEEVPAALEVLRRGEGLELTGLVSHFAEADLPESPANPRQRERFEEVLALLTADERSRISVHLANSAAALHLPASRHDLVRLGLALFGVDPAAGAALGPDSAAPDLEPVMAVRSRIVQLREVAEGTRVGYGGRWEARQPSRIAVVPVGYADGYAWRLGIASGAAAAALVGGRRVPLAGAVSMDMLTLDVTAADARLGDEVVLLGRQGDERLEVGELAAAAGTIPYELLCLLGLRLPRRYFRHGRCEGTASRFTEGTG